MLHKGLSVTRAKFSALCLFVVLVSLASFAFPRGPYRNVFAADPEIIAQYGFEDGTTQGWAPRGGGVTLAASTEAAHSGTYSLKTTGRSAGWHGPSLNLLGTLQKDATYKISGYVRLVAGQPPSRLIFTMQRTPTGGSTVYEWVAASAENGVTDAGWVKLEGLYTFTGDVSELVLYVESPNATAEFYLDDLTITLLSPPLPPGTIIQNGFEDGTTQGWTPRGGGVTLAASTEAAHSGTYSLKTTGRSAGWHGPSLNLLGTLQKDATYKISGYVRLVAGQPPSRLIFTMQRTPTGGSTVYEWVAASAENGVTDAGWVKLEGLYTFTGDVSELVLYVESPNATAEFYLDDLTITLLSPPLPPGTIIQNGFEDGTTQGWAPRGGGVTLAASTEAAHSGSHSLKTTGRTQNWHGPSLNLLGKLQEGAIYEISGYVRLVAGQPPSRLIFTMQRTPTGGSTVYEWVVASAENGVTDAGWVKLEGLYTFTGDASELVLYVESPNATAEFYLDDVTIVDQSGVKSDFESNTTEGWQPRIGAEILTVTADDAHGGSYSLLTTNRQNAYDGPSLNILGKMHKGSKYNISVWVKLAPGETPANLRVSIERRLQGTPNYDTVIGNTPVTADEWVHLAGSYTLVYDVDWLAIYVESASGTPSFYIDDFALTYVPQPPIQMDIPSVYETLADYFVVGAAIEPYQLESTRHVQLLQRHFNSITAENVMKWDALEPAEGQFNWANADRLIQFARANGLQVHGHTLQWHQQVPAWVFKDANGEDMQPTPENKALLLQRLENHIRAVAGRYRDDVDTWDVVNEVIDPDQPDCLRRSRWYEITGVDYIKTAFRVAREVAPDATLIINDYSTTDPRKRTCLYNLVRDLRAEGVPIDGVGHQMHINIENPSAAAIEETLQLFAGLGVDQQITELDMSIYTNDTDRYTTVPQEILIIQGYRYKEIFEVFRRYGDYISSVTFWGMADDHTWLKTWPIARVNLPLLFDEQLQAKYAYWGVVDPSKLPVLIKKLNVPKGIPFIDARPEFLWDMLPWVPLQATETLSASFQVRWSERFLYLFVDVNDPTRDRSDAVEVFIDENNGKTTSYESDDRHYTFKFGVHPPPGVRLFVMPKRDGYRLEAAFPLSTTATVGRPIGFDLRVTDGSQPDTPIVWNDWTNSQDSDTSKFGTLTLIDAVKWTLAAQGTPVIDGVKDRVWTRAAAITTNVWVMGSSGATATVKTLWDSSHLYVFAVVNDSLLSKASANPWEEDSIEVFVDQNNGKTTSYQADDGQYRVNYDNEQSFGGNASADRLVSATRIVPGGYVVEAAITLDAIKPKIGGLIGFDFQVNNDEDGDGDRDSVAIWNDPTGQSYQNTSRLGVLVFAAHKCGWPAWPPLFVWPWP